MIKTCRYNIYIYTYVCIHKDLSDVIMFRATTNNHNQAELGSRWYHKKQSKTSPPLEGPGKPSRSTSDFFFPLKWTSNVTSKPSETRGAKLILWGYLPWAHQWENTMESMDASSEFEVLQPTPIVSIIFIHHFLGPVIEVEWSSIKIDHYQNPNKVFISHILSII